MLKRIVLLVFTFGFLALGFYAWDQSNTALDADISVKGIYHEGRKCNGNGCASTPFVTFKTKTGTSVTFYPFEVNLARQKFLAAFYDESAYHEGQTVPVLYDPTSPAQAFIPSFAHLWLDAIFWFTLGACLLLGIMTWSLRQDRRKGR